MVEDKTHILRLTTRQRRMWLGEETLKLDIEGNDPVIPSTTERLLGATVHHNLSWRDHILSSKDAVINGVVPHF